MYAGAVQAQPLLACKSPVLVEAEAICQAGERGAGLGQRSAAVTGAVRLQCTNSTTWSQRAAGRHKRRARTLQSADGQTVLLVSASGLTVVAAPTGPGWMSVHTRSRGIVAARSHARRIIW